MPRRWSALSIITPVWFVELGIELWAWSMDFDGDGDLELVVNCPDKEAVSERNIEGYDASPTTVDGKNDGVPDLLIGAEEGHFYYPAIRAPNDLHSPNAVTRQ